MGWRKDDLGLILANGIEGMQKLTMPWPVIQPAHDLPRTAELVIALHVPVSRAIAKEWRVAVQLIWWLCRV